MSAFVSLGGAELHLVDVPLASGSKENIRAKFSVSQQKQLLERISEWLEDGTFRRGSWKDGEIEITDLRRVYSHRFWTEIQCGVLIPPQKGRIEPVPAAFAGIIPGQGFEPGSAVLLVKDPDTVALVELYRFHSLYAASLPERGNGWRLEAPRGGKKPEETHEQCAVREAREESGVIVGSDSRIFDLGSVEPDSGLLMSSVRLFAISKVDFDPNLVNLDVTESPTGVSTMTTDEAFRKIASGEIRCGITIALFTRALLAGVIRTSIIPGTVVQ